MDQTCKHQITYCKFNQLRVCLGPLYDHKWNHDFIDKCVVCNRAENLEHYFLNCARFTEACHALLDFVWSLNNVNFEHLVSNDKIKLLLYGDTSLGVVVNRLVIKATLEFLNDSKRFL